MDVLKWNPKSQVLHPWPFAPFGSIGKKNSSLAAPGRLRAFVTPICKIITFIILFDKIITMVIPGTIWPLQYWYLELIVIGDHYYNHTWHNLILVVEITWAKDISGLSETLKVSTWRQRRVKLGSGDIS